MLLSPLTALTVVLRFTCFNTFTVKFGTVVVITLKLCGSLFRTFSAYFVSQMHSKMVIDVKIHQAVVQ